MGEQVEVGGLSHPRRPAWQRDNIVCPAHPLSMDIDCGQCWAAQAQRSRRRADLIQEDLAVAKGLINGLEAELRAMRAASEAHRRMLVEANEHIRVLQGRVRPDEMTEMAYLDWLADFAASLRGYIDSTPVVEGQRLSDYMALLIANAGANLYQSHWMVRRTALLAAGLKPESDRG